MDEDCKGEREHTIVHHTSTNVHYTDIRTYLYQQTSSSGQQTNQHWYTVVG